MCNFPHVAISLPPSARRHPWGGLDLFILCLKCTIPALVLYGNKQLGLTKLHTGKGWASQ